MTKMPHPISIFIKRLPADTACITCGQSSKAELFWVSHLSFKAAQRLDQVGGPAHMKDWRGTALLPFTDAIIEAQQVGEAV